MGVPRVVEEFYSRVWEKGEEGAVRELVAEGIVFRGSLGVEVRGREGFLEYVRLVRGALAEYRCEILECVTEGERAFAKMRFSGRHVGEFRGVAATGRRVSWMGAALFLIRAGKVEELWVVGDLAGLDAALRAQDG